MGTGFLGHEFKDDALCGVHLDYQAYRLGIQSGIIGEGAMGNIAETNGYFGDLSRHAFAGSQVKGDTLPAPIVHEQLYSGEGFDIGARGDARLFAISDGVGAVYPAGGVLPARRVLVDRVFVDRTQGMEHIHFLATDIIGVVGHRRFHGDQTQNQHQVILHHVTQRAGVLVIAGTMLDSQRFRDCDRDMIDIAAIPNGFEDGIGEAHGENILYRFLAEKMIDTEYL